VSTVSSTTPTRERSSRRVIGAVTTRAAVRSGVGWGVVLGFYVALQALAYASSYPTFASREILVKEFGSNAGISALVGPATRIDTVPGYTSWKCLTVLAIVGAVWGLLLSTRMTRGEEDAGRWELLLSGATTRAGAARQALMGLASGWAALFITMAVIVVAIGRDAKVGIGAGAACYFCLAAASGAAMFLALGALAGQLASTRRQAAGIAATVLGAAYALRMVADSGTGVGALRWVSPLGWIEQMRPLTTPSTWALVPIVALTTVAGVLSAVFARHRDLGAGILASRDSARTRLRLLGGPEGLATRLQRPTVMAWFCAIAAYGLLLGGIAKSGGSIITSSPSLARVFARLGVSGADAFLGVAFLIMAVILNFVAAGQLSALRGEESSGRLDALLVRPLSRTHWLSGRLALAAGVLVSAGVLAAVATWVGAASDHAGVRFATTLDAGLNVVPPSLFLLGLGVLAFGLAPRLAVAVTYAALVWSFLVEIASGALTLNRWILDSSTLHQMAAAPSVTVNWRVNAVLAGLGVVLAAGGLLAFVRRDITGE
jgi:ABC-2 type transport system permease protein